MGNQKVVEMKPEPVKTETQESKKPVLGRNYYDKRGKTLICENEGCKNPRMRATQLCRKCAKELYNSGDRTK